MRNKVLIIAGVLLLLVGLFVVTSVIQKSKSQRALAAYLGALRAQGEPLTWEDLGYQPATETNRAFDAFVAAVGELDQVSPCPVRLDHMRFSGPGTVQIGWSSSQPPLFSNTTPGTNALTWEQLVASVQTASNALARLRSSLRNPPRYSRINLTNPFTGTLVSSFVQTRTAAQWLAADSLVALHEGKLHRAREELHALTQLVQLHCDDAILVSSMIRVAVARLGLCATWDSLLAAGWDENALADLQRDWQAIDLVEALERGMEAERVHIIAVFSQTGNSVPRKANFSGGLGSVWDIFAQAYWRNHKEEDQLLFLQTIQQRLDIFRKMRTNAPGFSVVRAMQSQDAQFGTAMNNPFTRYRHLLTAIAMPSFSKAIETVVKTEAQRRMTVTAIALKRYHLSNGQFPATLEVLVPDYLSQVPIDPMSGQAFCYRTNTDGSFTLYSVGEDGLDDGGDPTSTNAVKSFDLWSGDAVWPRAVE